MSDGLRSQLKWTPTGQNTNSLSIMKVMQWIETCELIMIKKSIPRVRAVYHTVLFR